MKFIAAILMVFSVNAFADNHVDEISVYEIIGFLAVLALFFWIYLQIRKIPEEKKIDWGGRNGGGGDGGGGDGGGGD
jgi:uncharacterized membrane protein YgcG